MTNKYLIFLVGLFVVALGVVFVVKTKKAQVITNFEECAKVVGVVMETYPRQCRTKDGKLFVEEAVPQSNIIVSTPVRDEVVRSPLVISGKARGSWYFEASFPVILLDGNGKQLFAGPATAQGEWMTQDFVPFRVSIQFEKPVTQTGTLVLKKDNPSGDSARDEEIRIPVRFE